MTCSAGFRGAFTLLRGRFGSSGKVRVFGEASGLRGSFGRRGAGGGGGGGGAPGGDPLELLSGTPSYIPADVLADGLTWCGVGLRFKGNASLAQTWQAGVEKLPMRLYFDHFEDERAELDDQRFYGRKELSMANGQGDATLMREVLIDELLESEGVPVARRAYTRVHLDTGEGPRLLGLYVQLEDPSDQMMERVYGDDGGNLYKPDGDCADLSCFDADSFEKNSNEDAADYSDVQALIDVLAADRSDAAAWRSSLEAVFAVDELLRWLAVNTVVENWDIYGGLAHNYYLYAVPTDGGRLHWIPWDHNLGLAESLRGASDPMQADVGADWPLIHPIIADAVYFARYRALLVEALAGQAEPAPMTARSARRAEVEAGLLATAP